MPTEADNAINHEEADKSNEKPAEKRESWRKLKRIRAKGSQTDDEALSDGEKHKRGCSMCNTKLNDIQGQAQ